jgi:hypothetical protein
MVFSSITFTTFLLNRRAVTSIIDLLLCKEVIEDILHSDQDIIDQEET